MQSTDWCWKVQWIKRQNNIKAYICHSGLRKKRVLMLDFRFFADDKIWNLMFLRVFIWSDTQLEARKLQHCSNPAVASCSKSARLICLAVIKPISGCVRIACSGLMITSLLRVVNRLAASWLSRLFIHKFDASFFNNLQQVWKYQLQQVWLSQTYCNLLTTCSKPLKLSLWCFW